MYQIYDFPSLFQICAHIAAPPYSRANTGLSKMDDYKALYFLMLPVSSRPARSMRYANASG